MTPPLLALAFLLVALAWWHQQRQAQWRKLRQYHRRQYWEWHKGINPEAARAYLRRDPREPARGPGGGEDCEEEGSEEMIEA